MGIEGFESWMEEYIPIITEGYCKSKKEFDEMIEGLTSHQFGIIVNLNAQINLLKNLKKQNKLI